jgi:hypothetical protein
MDQIRATTLAASTALLQVLVCGSSKELGRWLWKQNHVESTEIATCFVPSTE